MGREEVTGPGRFLKDNRETRAVSVCVCLEVKRKEVDDAGGSMTTVRCDVTCVAELLQQAAFKITYIQDRSC